ERHALDSAVYNLSRNVGCQLRLLVEGILNIEKLIDQRLCRSRARANSFVADFLGAVIVRLNNGITLECLGMLQCDGAELTFPNGHRCHHLNAENAWIRSAGLRVRRCADHQSCACRQDYANHNNLPLRPDVSRDGIGTVTKLGGSRCRPEFSSSSVVK